MQRQVQMPFGTLIVSAPTEELLATRVLGDSNYAQQYGLDSFVVLHDSPAMVPTNSYRSSMLKQGLYLGHHQGVPGDIELGPRALKVNLRDGGPAEYDKFFWTHALKYLLTQMSLPYRALHVKATSIMKHGEITLLLGRGASGKTSLAGHLENNCGYGVVGNTHAIVKSGYVWALNTWTRHRVNGVDQYVAPDARTRPREGRLARIVLTDANQIGEFREASVARTTALAFIAFFAAAVGTYDLKEDIVDGSGKIGLLDRLKLLEIEQSLMAELVEQVPITYLSADIMDPRSRASVTKLFGR